MTGLCIPMLEWRLTSSCMARAAFLMALNRLYLLRIQRTR